MTSKKRKLATDAEIVHRICMIVGFANRVGVNAQTTAGAKLLDIERLIERHMKGEVEAASSLGEHE